MTFVAAHEAPSLIPFTASPMVDPIDSIRPFLGGPTGFLLFPGNPGLGPALGGPCWPGLMGLC